MKVRDREVDGAFAEELLWRLFVATSCYSFEGVLSVKVDR